MNLKQAIEYLKKYEHPVEDSIPSYYFRGQTADYRNIIPTIARNPNGVEDAGELEQIRRQAYGVCELADKMASGIGGTVEEGLALMQHYGLVTPVVDVTATIDVAVFFAFLGHEAGKESVIYVFDREKAEENIQFVNHDFLLQSLGDGAQRCRWVRQDGYAVTIRDHHLWDKVMQFDLKQSACLVDTVRFTFEPREAPERSDYLELAGDPLAGQVQGIIRSMAEELFGGKLSRYLEERLGAMAGHGRLPEVKFGEIKNEMFKCENQFTVYFLKEALVILKDERVMEDEEVEHLGGAVMRIAEIKKWDTEVYAAVDNVYEGIEKGCGSEMVKKLVEKCFRECWEVMHIKQLTNSKPNA
jgi:hypothetical protein